MLYPLSYGGGEAKHTGGAPSPPSGARPAQSGRAATAGLQRLVPMIPDPLTTQEPDEQAPDPGRAQPPGTSACAPAPLTAEVGSEGQLRIGGVDVLELVEEVGTPVFIYDEEHLRRRCQEARQRFGPRAAYASKAFLCKAMARACVRRRALHRRIDWRGAGCCAGSGRARRTSGAARQQQVRGRARGCDRGRSRQDRCRLLRRDRPPGTIAEPAGATGPRPPPNVLVRVTPGIEAHTHEYVMTGQEDSKFGFGLTSGAAAEAIERLRHPTSCVRLVGIHAHIGSQIFALESFQQALAVLGPFFTDQSLEELCIGGGLGVPYITGEAAPSITDWAKTLGEAARAAGIADTVVLSAEPGRSIVAAAAITCYTVGTIKTLPGVRTYVSVDGGMSDNPRPVLYGSGYEAFLPREAQAPRPRTVTVVGKHCESGDVLVRDACVPEDLEVGDVLATPVTGAYGHAMASNYNKVPRPPVVFAGDGSWRAVVRRETYSDLLALDR